MQSDLENFLKEKRGSLDVEQPDDQVIWEGIREKIQETKRMRPGISIRMKRVIAIAAAVFILFSLGYITKDLISQRSMQRQVTLSDISKVLGQRENDYRSLVVLKSNEAKQFSGADNQIIRELFDQLKELDGIYNQSLTDLKKIGYNEKIVNTIFDTYEKKIQILELIILESNKTGSHENYGKIKL